MEAHPVIRLFLAIATPIAVPLLALWLHQEGVVTIPWIGGAVLTCIVAGFFCGVVWRSFLAPTYILVLGFVLGSIAIMFDDARYDPPAIALVPVLFLFIVIPAAAASIIGVGLGKFVSDV